jgi:hypothetical protein
LRQHLQQQGEVYLTELDILLEVPAASNYLAQVVHHARHADKKELVAKKAPDAAQGFPLSPRLSVLQE